MKRESLKQREQRISYQQAMGMRERNMADEICEECLKDPCVCKEKKLIEIRGGQ